MNSRGDAPSPRLLPPPVGQEQRSGCWSGEVSSSLAVTDKPLLNSWCMEWPTLLYIAMRIVDFKKRTSRSISSKKNLASALSITAAEIDALCLTPSESRYSELHRPKPNGDVRIVFNPTKLTRKIQTRINNRIFKDIVIWPYFVFGSIPKEKYGAPKDYIACANQHKGAGSILKIDVKNFFDNVHEHLVLNVFENFLKFPKPISEILTNICCRNGSLCQGAPTSSYIATLCLFDIEAKLVEKIERKGLVYTRYVDDITVSSKNRNYDFSYVSKLLCDALSEKELPVNHDKTVTSTSTSEALIVHGLRVNTSTARYPADEVRKIRAAVKNLEIVAREPNYIRSIHYGREFYKCQGRVNKLARVGHSQHSNFMKRLDCIRPMPSLIDISIAEKIIDRIKTPCLLPEKSFGIGEDLTSPRLD